MNLADIGGISALQAYCNMYGNGSLTFWSGTQPANPETNVTVGTNTASATFSLSAISFSTPSVISGFAVATASFTSNLVTPSVTETVVFARAAIETNLPWTASTVYSVGTVVHTSSTWFVCIVGGTSSSGNGPAGNTGTATLDGTVVWQFIGPTSGLGVLADFTVGTSGTDIIVGTTSFQSGVTVNFSSFKIELPVS